MGSTGKITASATDPDSSGGEIDLSWGSGQTKTIINRGTIEAKGSGSGDGGYIYMDPADLIANYGTIDVSGGSAGGSGGTFEAYVEYGNFYSSGTVLMNGGNGDTGATPSIIAKTAMDTRATSRPPIPVIRVAMATLSSAGPGKQRAATEQTATAEAAVICTSRPMEWGP